MLASSGLKTMRAGAAPTPAVLRYRAGARQTFRGLQRHTLDVGNGSRGVMQAPLGGGLCACVDHMLASQVLLDLENSVYAFGWDLALVRLVVE